MNYELFSPLITFHIFNPFSSDTNFVQCVLHARPKPMTHFQSKVKKFFFTYYGFSTIIE